MLTPRGAALVVGAFLLWGVGRLLGVPELYVVAVASAALVAAGAVTIRFASARVSARRSLSEPRILHEGTAEVTLELRNDSRLPAPLLLVEDSVDWVLEARPRFLVSGLRPGATTRLTYEITGTVRGRYSVGPLRLRVRDPFGTTQLVRRYSSSEQILVYPRVETLPDGLTRGNHRGSAARDNRRLLNAGDEFHTLRDYVQGDDLRMIHWPTTARRAKLVVRQHELPLSSEATVFCDTRSVASHGAGAEATMEVAISAAASVVWHLADRGYRLRLVTDEHGGAPGRLGRRNGAGPAGSVEGWESILEALAVAQPSRSQTLGPALARVRGAGAEGLLVCAVMVPPGDGPVGAHPDVRALLAAGRGWGERVAVVAHPPHLDNSRAAELVALLRTARWKATALPAGVPLAERWPEVLSARARAAAHRRSSESA